ncbi:MAG: anaerobic ribonucleoside-triphosphate reductase activating protein [Candidatus Aenigmarchaeota archaeon]|nr:anaerobic ribonucleoside-triphosphate reductase activating protein [Candidatus Aenigmarchaeota archaeon]
MIIGGFQKFSLIDYPGKICAIVFTRGCNFRCPYCHNPELVNTDLFLSSISEEKIFSFLEKRKGKLDAVEITGGEPTLQPDLIEFLGKIKDMGFLVKLDSNGTNPDIIEEVIKNKLVDYLAMDVKAPLEKYKEITCVDVDTHKIRSNIKLIMNSGIDYEFRTTIVKSLLSKEDIIKIGELIKGANLYILQKFVPSKTLNPDFVNETTYSDEEFTEMKNKMEKYVKRCIVR